MNKVLIVGNITKDVYLRLDNRQNHFEKDGNDVNWLDLAFNGSSHHFFARHAVYGGSSITLEVLSKFGQTTKISATDASFLENELIIKTRPQIYRYIICQDDNISYFSPSQTLPTDWAAPTEQIDWIYVDRSADISAKLVGEIMSYLALAQSTRLAVFVSKRTNLPAEHVAKMMERADCLIADVDTDGFIPHIRIGSDYVNFDGKTVSWSLHGRQNMMTHLTSHSIIAATVFGATLAGKNSNEALLMAQANVENANLDATLDLKEMEEKIMGEDYRVGDINKKENHMAEMRENAKKILSKGILAADESGGSIKKKFDSMNIEDTEQNRRDYRNIFFTTPGLEDYASGVILFDETSRQKADDGTDFVTFLNSLGVIPGIKVDQGLVEFDGSTEKYTQGLDGLPERLSEYYKMGARFAKWRSAFEVGEGSPSDMAIEKNAEILAQYAKDCQDAGIVPIVEPELVYDGDYTIEKNADITGKILDKLFEELKKLDVDLEACILKVNMVLAGKRYATQSTPEEVGKATAKILREHVPEELAGVVFLSGGQSPEQATDNLQAVTNEGPFPWPVTFSFARALQDPALFAWKGDNKNADTAREAFKARLVKNADALKKK